MSVSLAEDPRAPRRARLDLALVELFRIVRADSWAPETAARELRIRVRDDRFVLRMLRARIARVMLERPSQLGSRAAATLDHALPPGASAPQGTADLRSLAEESAR